MNEKLLQFLWQQQYFNAKELYTETGEPITIISRGTLNNHQGPDFINATILINTTKWVGNIEIHLKSSDWQKHKHQNDPNYNNVILHVVWEHDGYVAQNSQQKHLPIISLKSRVSNLLLQQYETLMQAPSTIACKSFLPHALSEIGWLKWKERLLAERLERKALQILSYLNATNQHWEQCFWWMLAANFGMPQNKWLFEAVAKSIDINILAKHKHQLIQIEALLLGQANLLAKIDDSDDYSKKLQSEYHFLAAKYSLSPVPFLPQQLRMRPGNFPSIRLVQLAKLIYQSNHLFSKLKEHLDYKNIHQLFNCTASSYWDNHYSLGKISSPLPKQLGSSMINSLIINTISPTFFAYGHVQNEVSWKEKAVDLLQAIKAEQNTITKGWRQNDVLVQNAFDSQALIELTRTYCEQKKCMSCAVGNSILMRK